MKKFGFLLGAVLSVTASSPALAAVDFVLSFDPVLLTGPNVGNVLFNANILNTGTENIVGRGGLASFTFDDLGPYVVSGDFGPTSSFTDFENQFSGLDLAPGATFSFVFANVTYNAPSGIYSVGTGSYLNLIGASGAEMFGEVAAPVRLAIGPEDSAVPEPATWALAIVGFGMAGAALRRRRAQVRFAF